MSGGGQLSYNLEMDIAVPGQLADQNLDDKVISFPAGEDIEFGRLLEVDTSGLVWKTKGTGASLTNGKLAGVSVLDVARPQALASAGGSSGNGHYKAGEMVPVLRKGHIYAAWDGGTGSFGQGVYVVPNVNHSSTTDPTDIKGTFTGNTTSSSAGSEVAAAPAGILLVRDVSALTPQRGAVATAGPPIVGPTFICDLEVNIQGAP